MIAIDEYPFEYGKYYIGNYIYYSSRNDDDIITVYRMDQNKSNQEAVINLPENVEKYTIYDNKIWYDYNNRQGISYYDFATGEAGDFDKGRIGIINNGYMYYTYYEELSKLLRFNLSNYEYEEVCGTEKDLNSKLSEQDNLYAFDFYEDYILYSLGNSLYKLSDNENTLIFSTKDYSEKYGRIDGIQCQYDRIFIKMGSGAFYQCIMEIDIDGNIIEVIHED